MIYSREETALVKACLAEPDDDLPRLVLADKFDENAGPRPCDVCRGNCGAKVNGLWFACRHCFARGYVDDCRAERAEFIRVQVAAANASPCLSCRIGKPANCFTPECRTQLDNRAKALLANRFEDVGRAFHFIGTDYSFANLPEVRSLRGYRPGPMCYLWWNRGFITHAHLPMPHWLAVGELPLGIGGVIAPHHPVYVDCPLMVPHHNGRGFTWYNAARGRPSGDVPAAAVLPSDVFVHLEFQGGRMSARGRWHAYHSIPVAREVLSRALVEWGRQRFEAKK